MDEEEEQMAWTSYVGGLKKKVEDKLTDSSQLAWMSSERGERMREGPGEKEERIIRGSPVPRTPVFDVM